MNCHSWPKRIDKLKLKKTMEKKEKKKQFSLSLLGFRNYYYIILKICPFHPLKVEVRYNQGPVSMSSQVAVIWFVCFVICAVTRWVANMC